MKRLIAWTSASGDRLNPVAVKELRQSVQSGWVITVLMLFLLICVVCLSGFLISQTESDTSRALGRETFQWLLGTLLFTCIGFVPLFTGLRMAVERNDAEVDLMFITTLTPWTIIRGKFFAAMALTLLIFSVCMPFMTLTYLLGGIDVPTIGFLLLFGFLACAGANPLGIFAGSITGSILLRAAARVGAILALFYMAVGCVAMADMILYRSSWGAWLTWEVLGCWFLLEVLGIGLLYVLSVAVISPKPSNRMFIPRVYLTACWLITGGLAVVMDRFYSSREAIEIWAVFSGVILMFLSVEALAERDAWTARVRRTIPRNRLLRAAAFLFYTGSAGGAAWCAMLFLFTALAAFTLGDATRHVYPRGWFDDPRTNVAITFVFVWCYCITATVIHRAFLSKTPAVARCIIALLLGAVLCWGPFLITACVGPGSWDNMPWLLVTSPAVLTTNNDQAKELAEMLAAVWLLVSLVISLPWANAQWRRFVPYGKSGGEEEAGERKYEIA